MVTNLSNALMTCDPARVGSFDALRCQFTPRFCNSPKILTRQFGTKLNGSRPEMNMLPLQMRTVRWKTKLPNLRNFRAAEITT
jgi:hypothetical protein